MLKIIIAASDKGMVMNFSFFPVKILKLTVFVSLTDNKLFFVL